MSLAQRTWELKGFELARFEVICVNFGELSAQISKQNGKESPTKWS